METSKFKRDDTSRKVLLFIFAIVICLGLYACGDNSTTGPGEEPEPEPEPEFDFSGELIAFRSDRGGSDDIWLMTPDGSELINITNDSEGASDPSWSPDGSRIAFVSLRTGNAELFVMNVDGTDVIQVTNNQGSIRWPRWSPDGNMIAFSANVNGQRDLYAVPGPAAKQKKSAGQSGFATTCDEPVQLTDHPETDNEPVWSPDGSSIYFFSTQDGIGGVWEIDFGCEGGSKPKKLTVEFEFACAPGIGFTLAGKPKISFVGQKKDDEADKSKSSQAMQQDDPYDVWMMDLDGSNKVKITDDPEVDWASSWTGDGRLIFETERNGNWDIYSIREDGSEMVQLTDHPAAERYPAWRPVE